MCRFQGTGKQFFIGMWEGDHALRKPGNLGHHVPPDVGRMETIQFVVQEKQRAVDNAKKDFGDACQNVRCPGIWVLCMVLTCGLFRRVHPPLRSAGALV